jgi:hypothetical protein
MAYNIDEYWDVEDEFRNTDEIVDACPEDDELSIDKYTLTMKDVFEYVEY